MQAATADAVLSAIAQSQNEVTQGWMRLMSSAPWLAELQKSAAGAIQAEYFDKQTRLWSALLAGRSEALVDSQADRRFTAKEWRENAYYDYLRQSYLLVSRYLEQLVEAAALDETAKDRARFAVRQWVDAMCPANFAATNPTALAEALASRGESLTRGLANLLGDAHKGRISQTDEGAFEVGRDLGVTPGDVVFENEVMQLLQYRPATKEVAARPLVLVPPCINKFYILDLQPENSFVAHAVAQGNTVFMVSWRNVGPEQGHLTWDDYLEKGVLAALRVAREITGSKEVNALGFCVGGTLLGAALAEKKPAGVTSVTLLATMLDFADTGQIGFFVDEASVAAREAAIGKGGIFPGAELAFVFSSLRANDLVWPYVVNNYLLGGKPAAFDLLYWNSDSTNLPGPMYCQYLRSTYLENKLKEQVDFRKIGAPLFVVATREDHIVPWRSAYRSVHLFGAGEKSFVLGASGHIAGIVNPPDKKRRSHWVFDALPENPDDGLAAAKEIKGSWWPRWSEWLATHAGGTKPAPAKTGNAKYKPIEPAPGRYVKQKAS
ncbi:MAG: poly[(R)-3-hydroxyalkanoate] polymerase subunit PhaC [Betaproteobacteria bacterium]|jgi:polyhydroxyalkanoate synthase|nr:poly[(R)-3-hydroxyalkanoate] polymerase subunit PhaC [Betaproteobacteria bacterium]